MYALFDRIVVIGASTKQTSHRETALKRIDDIKNTIQHIRNPAHPCSAPPYPCSCPCSSFAAHTISVDAIYVCHKQICGVRRDVYDKDLSN